MTIASIEKDIAALAAQADPLRVLPEDEPAKTPLAALVDQINALRAKQARLALEMGALQDEQAEAELVQVVESLKPAKGKG